MTPKQLHATVIAMTICVVAPASAQDRVDPLLMKQIAQIKAIDNHTHAEPADPARGNNWRPAAPLGTSRYPDVVPLRRDNPDWIRAWHALYAYPHTNMQTGNLQRLLETKRQTMRKFGNDWPRHVLDMAGVEVALVNATSLGAGQRNARFRWVPYADPMLDPFSGDKSALSYTGGPSTINQLLTEAQVSTLPATLTEYNARVVDSTLARWAAEGAVAVKFLAAYARGLDFESTATETADGIYARGVVGQPTNPSERKMLQDYLFREIAARAGAHRLVVHIHTGNGDGPYFNNTRANPGLLEAAIGSQPLRKTNFVLLHGGWPFHHTTQAMLDKPNTYADFSAQTFYLGTHALAEVLRGWLGWHPEKVLFGSDAYSDMDSPLTDYEEKQWLMTDKARKALGIALTAMMRDGEITRERALVIARMVLRDNAIALYRLK